MPEYRSASGSGAEDLFIDLFADTFGAEKAGYLYSQYPFYDIYQNARFADFVLENGETRVAIEIDEMFEMKENLILANYKVESEAYQALSELKRETTNANYTISQAAL